MWHSSLCSCASLVCLFSFFNVLKFHKKTTFMFQLLVIFYNCKHTRARAVNLPSAADQLIQDMLGSSAVGGFSSSSQIKETTVSLWSSSKTLWVSCWQLKLLLKFKLNKKINYRTKTHLSWKWGICEAGAPAGISCDTADGSIFTWKETTALKTRRCFALCLF